MPKGKCTPICQAEIFDLMEFSKMFWKIDIINDTVKHFNPASNYFILECVAICNTLFKYLYSIAYNRLLETWHDIHIWSL